MHNTHSDRHTHTHTHAYSTIKNNGNSRECELLAKATNNERNELTKSANINKTLTREIEKITKYKMSKKKKLQI